MSFDWVYENLYVGDIESLDEQASARDEGIRAVVRLDLADRHKRHWDDDFTVLDRPIPDGASMDAGVISEVTTFIHEQHQQENAVLVHCAMGVSRSVTLTMAYLIGYENMSLAEAFSTVREGRTIARPHPALLASLVDYYDLPYSFEDVRNPHFISKLMQDI